MKIKKLSLVLVLALVSTISAIETADTTKAPLPPAPTNQGQKNAGSSQQGQLSTNPSSSSWAKIKELFM